MAGMPSTPASTYCADVLNALYDAGRLDEQQYGRLNGLLVASELDLNAEWLALVDDLAEGNLV